MKYPNKIQKHNPKIITYANRGMELESLINQSNEYYLEINRALIYKKPTPIGINKACYNQHGRVIKEGYFLAPSTLDYNGLYQGKYIEFEAKETTCKTSFPLANFHEHQIHHIRKVIEHQGIVFILIQMNQKVHLLKGTDFISFLDTSTRKSIPYSFIEEKSYTIPEKINPPLDYLSVVDKIYF